MSGVVGTVGNLRPTMHRVQACSGGCLLEFIALPVTAKYSIGICQKKEHHEHGLLFTNCWACLLVT